MAMTLRLTTEEEQLLDRVSARTGLSRQKTIILALEQMDDSAQRKKDLEFAREFVMTHDKKLMERLADA